MTSRKTEVCFCSRAFSRSDSSFIRESCVSPYFSNSTPHASHVPPTRCVCAQAGQTKRSGKWHLVQNRTLSRLLCPHLWHAMLIALPVSSLRVVSYRRMSTRRRVTRSAFTPVTDIVTGHASNIGVLRLVGRRRILCHDLHVHRHSSRRRAVSQAHHRGSRSRSRDVLLRHCDQPVSLRAIRPVRRRAARSLRRTRHRVGGDPARRCVA